MIALVVYGSQSFSIHTGDQDASSRGRRARKITFPAMLLSLPFIEGDEIEF